jgi:hypothetical protein
MKKQIIFLPIIFLILFSQLAFSQDTTNATDLKTDKKENTKNEISPELKKDAVEFLRNTAVEVNNMRTLENRISFSAEMAGLMWFSNENEARAMYQNVISNFRQLLAQYDAELNAMGITPEDASGATRYSNTAKSKVARKFSKALGVRQQVTTSLAEHDPRLAFEFFTETAQAISNPEMRKQTEQSDAYFETRLLQQIAENDIETALKYARKNLAKGFNYETVSLLRKIYDKDTDKGIAFGEDIISKLKSDAPNPEGFYFFTSLLSFGEETIGNSKDKKTGKEKRPIFSDQNMREIAEILAQEILKREDGSEFEGYISQIEKYSPARALQIRTKFGLKKNNVKVSTKVASVESPLPDSSPVPPNAKENLEKQLTENIGNLGKKELTDEEKQKIVEQSRKIINSIDDRNQKIMALSGLALQVFQTGDKKLATEILDESRSLINYQPVNYRDYMETWLLIGGYSQIDAEKAFPILESTIYRLNDTISAFVKVGEFIDVEGEMVEEGEVQLGSFGGGMTRELMGGLGVAIAPVRSLAIADFKRTKDLTNRFDRQEVRILAKMLVLRAMLGNDKDTNMEDTMPEI